MSSRSPLLLAVAAFACPHVARGDDFAQMNAYVAEVLTRNPSLHAEALRRDAYGEALRLDLAGPRVLLLQGQPDIALHVLWFDIVLAKGLLDEGLERLLIRRVLVSHDERP